MKHLRLFETENNYASYENSSDYITPNVCCIKETNGIVINPAIVSIPPPVAGDVAYWDGSSVKTIPLIY